MSVKLQSLLYQSYLSYSLNKNAESELAKILTTLKIFL